MKKFVALLIALTLVLYCFAGCSQEPADPGVKDPDTTPTESSGNPEAPTDPTEPEVFRNTDIYPLSGEHKLTMGVTIENADKSDLFGMMEKATGVSIEYQVVTTEQAPLLFAGNVLPDMMFSSNMLGLTVAQINEYGEAGMLINYMEHLDKMPNLAKAYAEDPRLFSAVSDASGAVYTLPSYIFTLSGCKNILYFREDHMAQAGWEAPPKTIDEFTQYLRDLRTTFEPNDPDYVALSAYQGTHMQYSNVVAQYLFPSFGEYLEPTISTDREGKQVIAGFATEQFKRYVTYMHELYEEGLLDPNCFNAQGDLMKAFLNEGHSSVSTIMSYIPKTAFPSGEMEVDTPAPFTSEYNSESTWILPSPYKSWLGLISSKCTDLDAALAYMDAYFSVEENPLNEEGTVWGLCFWLGEYGKTWEWGEQEGTMHEFVPEGYDNKTMWSSEHGYSSTPYIGIFNYLSVDKETGVAFWKAVSVQEDLMPVAVDVIRISELHLTEDEQDEYNDVWNDINTYLNQMNAAFITGEVDIDAEWDNYLATLESMGLQTVIDCYQAALDRYNASLS